MSTTNFFDVTDLMLNDIQKHYTIFQRNVELSKKQLSNGHTLQGAQEEICKNYSGKDNGYGEIIPTEVDQKIATVDKPKGFIKNSFAQLFCVCCTVTKNRLESKKILTHAAASFAKIQKSETYQMFKDIFGFDVTIWKEVTPLKRPDKLNLGLIGVALFKGNEIVSKAIRKFTKSVYSHVALLVHDIEKDKDDQDGWYTYSANGSAAQILHEHRFPQVQLEKWVDVIKDYDGAAGVRMISFQDGAAEPDSNFVTQLVDKFLGLPYESQFLTMLKALNRSNVEHKGSADSAFCSEICYRFLVSVGVIEDTEIPENVWPKDFSEENDKLRVKNGVWGELVVFKGTFIKKKTLDANVDNNHNYISDMSQIESKNLTIIPIGL